MLPGPFSLNANNVVVRLSTNSTARTTGSTAPFIFPVSWALPSENPFFKAIVPVNTPAANPMNPTYAFKSPAAMRITMRSGHPKNAREPIIMMTPRIKRSIGDDPAVERYSLVARAIRKEPQTKPTISGLKYCTTAAV